jgi:acyl dehydratase
MLLYSVVCGAISRHFPGAVQLSQELKFPAPTYANEPMTIDIQVLGQDAATAQIRLLTEMKNPEGAVTLTGEAVILL